MDKLHPPEIEQSRDGRHDAPGEHYALEQPASSSAYFSSFGDLPASGGSFLPAWVGWYAGWCVIWGWGDAMDRVDLKIGQGRRRVGCRSVFTLL